MTKTESFNLTLTANGTDYGFRVDDSGSLIYYYRIYNEAGYFSEYTYSRFAVGVITANPTDTIRPGDDMLFRFALTYQSDVVAQAADGVDDRLPLLLAQFF